MIMYDAALSPRGTNASTNVSDGASTNAPDSEQASVPHDTQSSTASDESVRRAPRREAGRYQVRCPKCKVPMHISHLTYKHVCKRTADPRARAVEMQEQTRERFRERTGAADRDLPDISLRFG